MNNNSGTYATVPTTSSINGFHPYFPNDNNLSGLVSNLNINSM
jgi:hypothetical protein